jgi:ABC-type uncharacterized transport system substrate-binding protein
MPRDGRWPAFLRPSMASGSSLTAQAAKAATNTVPVVLNGDADPVKPGWVVSLNRPAAM